MHLIWHGNAGRPSVRNQRYSESTFAYLIHPEAFQKPIIKELNMPVTKPNRTNVQSANPSEMRKAKNSGDQHLLPQDEPALDPHRPHRISRDDMQKTLPGGAEPEDPLL